MTHASEASSRIHANSLTANITYEGKEKKFSAYPIVKDEPGKGLTCEALQIFPEETLLKFVFNEGVKAGTYNFPCETISAFYWPFDVNPIDEHRAISGNITLHNDPTPQHINAKFDFVGESHNPKLGRVDVKGGTINVNPENENINNLSNSASLDAEIYQLPSASSEHAKTVPERYTFNATTTSMRLDEHFLNIVCSAGPRPTSKLFMLIPKDKLNAGKLDIAESQNGQNAVAMFFINIYNYKKNKGTIAFKYDAATKHFTGTFEFSENGVNAFSNGKIDITGLA